MRVLSQRPRAGVLRGSGLLLTSLGAGGPSVARKRSPAFSLSGGWGAGSPSGRICPHSWSGPRGLKTAAPLRYKVLQGSVAQVGSLGVGVHPGTAVPASEPLAGCTGSFCALPRSNSLEALTGNHHASFLIIPRDRPHLADGPGPLGPGLWPS